MDEYLNNSQNQPEEAVSENESIQQEIEVSEQASETDNFQNDFTPVYNPVNYSPTEEIKDYSQMSKGLKVFSLIIAAVILITGSCAAGYFFGKNSTRLYKNNYASKVDLAAVPEDTNQMTAAQVYEKADKSVVGIVVYNSEGKISQASGIVFSKDGFIVTNDHIYSEIPLAKFKIYTYDGTEYDATYVAGDIVSDLAVLKVDTDELQPAEFGNSDELYYGQSVVAIGRPNDATESSSITTGIISGLDRRVTTTSSYSARLIQTDSAINPGSSGGALVNMYGQVVGVTSSKLASVSYDDVGYAIPTTVMKRIVEELISEGKVVTRAKLGISYLAINSVTAELNGYEHLGLYIDSVETDSGLYGKAEKGDIITQINGIEVTSDDIVLNIIEQSRAGDEITVTIIKSGGKTVTVDAKLKANIGESSYSKNIENSTGGSSDGTFDFPDGY